MDKETLEEVAENYNDDFQIKSGSKAPHIKNVHIMNHFIAGAKWMQERMYSDMQEYAEFCIRCYEKGMPCIIAEDWFEQFKKK